VKRRVAAAAVALAVSPAVATAGQPPLTFTVTPTYYVCIAAQSGCSPYSRLSVAGKYAWRVGRRTYRFKLAREYQQATADDSGEPIVVGPPRVARAATDTLQLRTKYFDDDGYERNTWQAAYSYQRSTGPSGAYHTLSLYDNAFFGRRILRGSDGPARRFNVLLKVFRNDYQAAGVPSQEYVQLSPSATAPLNATGSWRAVATYTLQDEIAGGSLFTPSSQRLTVTLTRDAASWLKGFVRLDARRQSNASEPAPQTTTTLIVGADVTF
jgi:hypothetical protein